MRKVLFVILALLISAPVLAQNTPEERAVFDTLKELRQSYPTPMAPEQIGKLLNDTALRHPGWFLLQKSGGTRCPFVDGVREISCDILISVRTQHHYDVLRAQETEAEPVWSDVGPCVLGPTSGCEMSRAIPPIGAVVTPAPTPQPDPTTPEPPSQGLSEAFGKIIALLSETLEMTREQVQLLREQNAILEKRLNDLSAQIRGGIRIRW